MIITTNTIQERLIELLNSSEPFGIALNAKWGVGKTFFWNQLIKEKFSAKKTAYISLFGVETIQQIKNDLLLQIYTQNGFVKKIKDKVGSFKLYGMDIIGGGFLPPKRRSNTIEDFERNIQEIIDKKDPRKRFIYVLDSFDSITSDDEIKFKNKKLKASVGGDDDGESAGSYGLSKQKESHSFFRTKIRELEEHKIVLIIVSQVKEKINVSFGKKLYRTGGKSLDFYPNVVFWLAEVEKYRKKDRPVGICSKVQATKSRNDKPFRECLVDMVFDYGIDNVASNINFLFELKTDGNRDKKKLNCLWNKKEYTREELIKHIEKNNLEEELAEKVIEKWNAIEDSISSSGRKSRWS